MMSRQPDAKNKERCTREGRHAKQRGAVAPDVRTGSCRLRTRRERHKRSKTTQHTPQSYAPSRTATVAQRQKRRTRKEAINCRPQSTPQRKGSRPERSGHAAHQRRVGTPSTWHRDGFIQGDAEHRFQCGRKTKHESTANGGRQKGRQRIRYTFSVRPQSTTQAFPRALPAERKAPPQARAARPRQASRAQRARKRSAEQRERRSLFVL